MIERETGACEICGKPTHYTGTKRCNNCWEVERRLPEFIRSANGLKAVAAALQQVHGNSSKDTHENDAKLRDLYVELDAIDIALADAMFKVNVLDLNKQRANILGDIKELERLWV
jgi:hypothetical protein